MRSLLHEIDPDGDLIVVLNEPNTQKLIPDVYIRPRFQPENPNLILDKGCLRGPPHGNGLPFEWDRGDHSPFEVRFRVSSRHLMLASATFKKMLSGPWKESQPVDSQASTEASDAPVSCGDSSSGDQGPSNPRILHSPCIREVSTTGWNVGALLAVFNVIHHQYSDIPNHVGVKFRTEVAVVANYYQCAHALSLAMSLWLRDNLLIQRHEHRYGELFMWIFIAWVFDRDRLFNETTYLAVYNGYALSCIETHDLPISEIIAALEIKRLNALQSLTSALSDIKGKAKRNELGCRYHRCRAMIIGSLELNVEDHPELTVEDGNYDGLSIKDVINAIQQFEPSESETCNGMHLCTPKLLMQSVIRSVEEEISTRQ